MRGFYDTRFDEVEILDVPYNFYVIRDYNSDLTHVEFKPTLLSKSVLGMRQNRGYWKELIKKGTLEVNHIRTFLIDGNINAAEEIAKRIFEQARKKLSLNL